MNKSPQTTDTTPWYRQFWPWFLIALPASVVVAGITTVIIANRGADDLVADEYYKDGLAINRKLEKRQQAAQLGIAASLRISGDEVAIQVSGPVSAERLVLLLSHPLESSEDYQVTLVRSLPGEYRGRLGAAPAPRWHWALLEESTAGWRLDGSLTAADFDSTP